MTARTSFTWLCTNYLASAALAPRTQDDYRKVIENRLLPVLGPERFDCITRPAITMRWRARIPPAPRTK